MNKVYNINKVKSNILKITTLIILIIVFSSTTLFINFNAPIVEKEAKLYTGDNNIPSEIVLSTTFIEELYGSISNLEVTGTTVSFDITNEEAGINERLTINIDKVENASISINPTIRAYDIRKSLILNNDIDPVLEYFYVADFQDIEFDILATLLNKGSVVYVTISHNGFDSDYTISNFVLYAGI